MSHLEQIKSLLPYQSPFLFVDEYIELEETGAKGRYQLRKDEYFYQGHFPDRPITPGVILTEIMAQIGLVGLGMYLTKSHLDPFPRDFVFTSSEVDFLKPVYPGETVRVESEKVYFRLGKLKCKVKMLNESGETVCKGMLSGMMIRTKS